jgi:UDP-glucose 4-epimerase
LRSLRLAAFRISHMSFFLVTGACGFVGRNLVKRLLQTHPEATILMVDDLSVGTRPETWLPSNYVAKTSTQKDLKVYGEAGKLLFWEGDFAILLRHLRARPDYLASEYGLPNHVDDVFHFAAIVGGRSKIDGDPMAVALDLAIDAEFFYWCVQHKPTRILYPSSSAAYPVQLQAETGAIALSETDIDFAANLGKPDMTYGWSKLTGEYLARIAAQHYGLHVACVRPFSGYGEDQDLSYPVPAIARRAARKEDPFEVWGTGKQGRDFVHIDDCIDLILLALDRVSDGSALNIGHGKLTSFIEIIELMTSFAGYKPTIKQLLDKPVGVHARYANMAFVNEQYGWKPRISIEEGMRRVYEAALARVERGEVGY